MNAPRDSIDAITKRTVSPCSEPEERKLDAYFLSGTNTIGSYECKCNAGYSGDGFNCFGKFLPQDVTFGHTSQYAPNQYTMDHSFILLGFDSFFCIPRQRLLLATLRVMFAGRMLPASFLLTVA